MRINLFAGAGAGKSTLSPYIFHQLKKHHYNVESVQEYIKKWACEGRFPKSFAQCYIFGKQLYSEDSWFQAGVEHVVTDSPVLMQVFYARKHGFCCWESLLEIALAFEEKYPSLNFFLDRTGIPYRENGRYESEEEAKANDLLMQEFIGQYVDFEIIPSVDEVRAYHAIEKKLTEVTNELSVV